LKILKQYFSLLRKGYVESRKVQFLVILSVFVLIFGFSPFRIAVVATPSIPVGVYVINEFDKELLRGGMYCFDNYKPDWVNSELKIPGHQISCKYLLGMPGDSISSTDGSMSLMYTDLGGVLGPEELTKTYKRISSIDGVPVGFVDSSGVIPINEYYFGSDFPNGWDSRYLGLIKEELVLGKASLLIAL
jgi:type IV secretory pathway protease TraF